MLHIHRISTTGPRFHAGVGAGFLRYPITTYEGVGSDESVTDTVATGPLLLGIGAGYAFTLGGPVRLAVDVSVVGAVAVIDEVSGTPVESGLNLEIDLGFMIVR